MSTLADLKYRTSEVGFNIKANKAVLDRSRTELLECEEQIKTLQLAGETLKAIGEDKKKATIGVIETVVTYALTEVFGFSYKFVVEVSTEKKVNTRFKLVDTQGNEHDIMDSFGGGLIDVVSFVLRALILVGSRPKRERILFLDESFKHVHVRYRSNVVKMLQSLSKELGLQIVLVTHQDELVEAGDKVYELFKGPEGDTQIKAI